MVFITKNFYWGRYFLDIVIDGLVIPLSGFKKNGEGGLEKMDRAGNQYDLVWLFIVIPIVLVIMMIYSGYVFANEVKNDIMSKETYEREKVALCC